MEPLKGVVTEVSQSSSIGHSAVLQTNNGRETFSGKPGNVLTGVYRTKDEMLQAVSDWVD